MGSGTTAIASKLLGFDYLGIEIGKEYLNMTKARLKNAQNEIDKIEQETRSTKSLKHLKKEKKTIKM